MPERKFKFEVQAALDKAKAEEDQAGQRLARAMEFEQREREELARCIERVEQTRQQIRRSHDNLAAAVGEAMRAADMVFRSQHIEALRDQERSQLEQIERQREALRHAQEVVELRRQELAQQMAKVQALVKLKERRREEFQVELDRAEEAEREDDVIQQWNRKAD